jgi:hypothetical protein
MLVSYTKLMNTGLTGFQIATYPCHIQRPMLSVSLNIPSVWGAAVNCTYADRLSLLRASIRLIQPYGFCRLASMLTRDV